MKTKFHHTEAKEKSFIHHWLGFLFNSMISMEITPRPSNSKSNKVNPPGTKLLKKMKDHKLGLK